MKTVKNQIPFMVLAIFFLAVCSAGLVAQQKDTKVKVEQKQKVETKGVQQKKVDTLGQQQKKTDAGIEEKKMEVKEKDGKGENDKIGDTAKALGRDKGTGAQGNAYGRNKDNLSGREFGQQRSAGAKAKKTATQAETMTKIAERKANRKKNR